MNTPNGRDQSRSTVKQQRQERRQAKVAAYQRRLQSERRRKVVLWVVGGVATAALAVVAVGALVVSFSATPPAQYSAGSAGDDIDGVETFSHTTEHTQQTVEYEQTPPAGGPHNPYWLNCGVYTEPQTNENAVHSLEHGAVWVTYDPEFIDGDDLASLERLIPSSYAILSPYPDLGSPVAVSAWNAQLRVDSVKDERISDFFEEYWRSQNVPEPNAACTGAVDGPGQTS